MKQRWPHSVASLLCLLGCSSDDANSAGERPPGYSEGYPKPCNDLYDESKLLELSVDITEEQWSGLQADCQNQVEEFRPITLHVTSGGELESVAAMWRLKGNWSWNCDKMQFLISFNESDPDARFHGLRKLVLDAPWYDHTLLNERLSFYYLQRRGVPYSCVNHARLNVNGEYYGLYANVERLDREYLERHFDDPDGNLWKEGRELKTNEETGTSAKIDAFWASTDAVELETMLDIPAALRLWSSLAMLPDPDSYWAGVEINFYLYEKPSGGLAFLPYDADLTFAENIWPELAEMDPITHEHHDWGREPQYRAILSDPKWCERFETELRAAHEAYDVGEFESRIEAWSEQIEEALSADPSRTFSDAEHAAAMEKLRTFPARRSAFIDTWLAESHCPVQWPDAD